MNLVFHLVCQTFQSLSKKVFDNPDITAQGSGSKFNDFTV